ncbi:MAG: cupin domain-containing protein [Terracidiphilus sp.]
MTAEEIKALLKLQPHPIEGGWYRRTYTSGASVDLPPGVRAQGTAIYYLLEEETFSEMHMLTSDEIFHFYLGDPVEMLLLYPSGHCAALTLGSNLGAGQQPQILVPAGVWQGERLVEGGKLALLGCTVTPGFDYADYHSGNYAELVAKWPVETERIKKLTRSWRSWGG